MRSRRSSGNVCRACSDRSGPGRNAARRPTVSRRGDLSTQDRRAVARPPERFGPWKSVYNRFANWSRRGCGGTFLSRYSSTSMTRVRSSTLPSSARTKTLRAEKVGPDQCLGRCRGGFRRNSRRRGPARAASVCHTDARPASRNHRRPAAHRARARPGFRRTPPTTAVN